MSPARNLQFGPLGGNVVASIIEMRQVIGTAGFNPAIDHRHGHWDIDAATTVTVPRFRVVGVLPIQGHDRSGVIVRVQTRMQNGVTVATDA